MIVEIKKGSKRLSNLLLPIIKTIKYQLDMKDILVRRVKIQLKFAEEKIMLYMFFLAMHTAVLIACIVEGATIIDIPAVLIILFLLLIGKNIREHRILSILIYDEK